MILFLLLKLRILLLLFPLKFLKSLFLSNRLVFVGNIEHDIIVGASARLLDSLFDLKHGLALACVPVSIHLLAFFLAAEHGSYLLLRLLCAVRSHENLVATSVHIVALSGLLDLVLELFVQLLG